LGSSLDDVYLKAIVVVIYWLQDAERAGAAAGYADVVLEVG
jgi:hypothetical protein